MIKVEFFVGGKRHLEKLYENEDDLLLDLDLPYIKINQYSASYLLPKKYIELVKIEEFET